MCVQLMDARAQEGRPVGADDWQALERLTSAAREVPHQGRVFLPWAVAHMQNASSYIPGVAQEALLACYGGADFASHLARLADTMRRAPLPPQAPDQPALVGMPELPHGAHGGAAPPRERGVGGAEARRSEPQRHATSDAIDASRSHERRRRVLHAAAQMGLTPGVGEADGAPPSDGPAGGVPSAAPDAPASPPSGHRRRRRRSRSIDGAVTGETDPRFARGRGRGRACCDRGRGRGRPRGRSHGRSAGPVGPIGPSERTPGRGHWMPHRPAGTAVRRSLRARPSRVARLWRMRGPSPPRRGPS